MFQLLRCKDGVFGSLVVTHFAFRPRRTRIFTTCLHNASAVKKEEIHEVIRVIGFFVSFRVPACRLDRVRALPAPKGCLWRRQAGKNPWQINFQAEQVMLY